MRNNKRIEGAPSLTRQSDGRARLSTDDRRRSADEADALASIRGGLEQARNGMGRNTEDVFNELERETAFTKSTR